MTHPLLILVVVSSLLVWVARPALAADPDTQAPEGLELATGSALEGLDPSALADIDGVTVENDGRSIIVDEGQGVRVELHRTPKERQAGGPVTLGGGSAAITPEWSVGFGWYVYIYMTGSEAQTFTSYAYTAFSAIICGVAVTTVVGGVVCALIAKALYDYLLANAFTSWRCYEFRFTYAGNLVGVSTVSSSHC